VILLPICGIKKIEDALSTGVIDKSFAHDVSSSGGSARIVFGQLNILNDQPIFFLYIT
jgi:hypothetical protein